MNTIFKENDAPNIKNAKQNEYNNNNNKYLGNFLVGLWAISWWIVWHCIVILFQ